ncbi:MAG: hypothetical protein RLY71_459 [Pseudomonadota bacterium]|jgi:hypothetical protein
MTTRFNAALAAATENASTAHQLLRRLQMHLLLLVLMPLVTGLLVGLLMGLIDRQQHARAEARLQAAQAQRWASACQPLLSWPVESTPEIVPPATHHRAAEVRP